METSRSPRTLEGKTVLLAGASTDLRYALAEAFRSAGASPFVVGPVASPVSAQACANLFDSAEAALGAIDIAVLVFAPLDEPTSIAALTLDQYDAITDALTKAPFFLLQQAARRVQDNGKVIVVQAGLGDTAAHAGAAAAMQVYIRVLTRETGARGITVNLVSAPPEDRQQPLDDLIQTVLFIAGPDGRWINAQTLHVGAVISA